MNNVPNMIETPKERSILTLGVKYILGAFFYCKIII